MLNDMRALLLIFVSAMIWAQVPTAKEALSMERPMGVVISPDGKHVAYTASRTNWEDNVNESDVYLAEVASGARRRLTAGKKAAMAPAWSPDGKSLAFLSNREGKNQIYVLPLEGGEAVQLTDHETAVSSFEWKQAETIYFVAADAEPEALKARKKEFGEFVVMDADYTMSHLWKIAVSDKPKQKAERLTEGKFHVLDAQPSPDGRLLAVLTKANPELSTLGNKLEILDLATKQRRVLAETKASFGDLTWSPDGKELAYTKSNDPENAFYATSHIAVQAVDGGEARNTTPGLDESPSIVSWTGVGILFSAGEKTGRGAYLAKPKEAKFDRMLVPQGWNVSSVTITKNQRRAAFVGAPTGGYYEVYTSPTTDWSPKALTAFSGQWSKFKPARREVVSWKSKDGETVEGVLITPPDFDKSKKYPLLIVIHGGPRGVDVPVVTPDSYYPIEQFVAKGAVVLRPNYRGSAGYGTRFRALNVRNLGVGDAMDVLSGVDHLVAQGFVDPARVGSMGWSQGGYISAFLATAHGDKFKALSVGAGISNWMTYYVNTDIHPFTRQYLKATPWEDKAIYEKTSPMTYIKTAKAPVLIQHGDNDKRVPPPNAFELYQGLKDVGVESRLVLYKGFGHGINKPKEAQHVIEENLSWFSKYVLDAKAGQ